MVQTCTNLSEIVQTCPKFSNSLVLLTWINSKTLFLGRTFSEVIDHREIANLKEDLQAVREKASADEEVISVLQKQVEELQKEKETL